MAKAASDIKDVPEGEKMEVDDQNPEVEKEKKKTPVEIYLEKLTVTLTRDFPNGTQGDIATLSRAVESIHFYRRECQKLNSAGLGAVCHVGRVFAGHKDPFDPSISIEASAKHMRLTVGSMIKNLQGISSAPSPQSCFIECASFLSLLSVLCLTDVSEENVQFGYDSFTELWEALQTLNRRSADFIAAKVCFYRILYHGKLNFDNADIRTSMLRDYRTCVLNHNEPCQAVITNLILQKYIEDNLIAQAAKFSTKANIPERADPYQIARYNYYVGRINIVQLQYGDAQKDFRTALRKAPQKGAIGFKQIVTKYFVVTQLLMGDIPERSIFRQEGLTHSLKPYFQLTQAVRVGDMKLFDETIDEFSDRFNNDGVFMLITRLRHNVIKAALRKISVSYSRIHLDDVAKKLNLNSALEAEYIVAKAIKDGVIDAIIDHNKQQMRSTEVASIYSTVNPQHELDKRIEYCLQLHQNCVRAFRYKEEEEEKEDEKKKEKEEDGKDIEEIVEEVLKRLEKGDDDEGDD
jgi:26S proteasome regulatory subunit N3